MSSSTLRSGSIRTRLLLKCLEDRLTPGSLIWDGGGDNIAWMNAPNWNPDALPQNYDSVTLGYSAITRVLAAGSGGGGGISPPGGPPGPPGPPAKAALQSPFKD